MADDGDKSKERPPTSALVEVSDWLRATGRQKKMKDLAGRFAGLSSFVSKVPDNQGLPKEPVKKDD